LHDTDSLNLGVLTSGAGYVVVSAAGDLRLLEPLNAALGVSLTAGAKILGSSAPSITTPRLGAVAGSGILLTTQVEQVLAHVVGTGNIVITEADALVGSEFILADGELNLVAGGGVTAVVEAKRVVINSAGTVDLTSDIESLAINTGTAGGLIVREADDLRLETINTAGFDVTLRLGGGVEMVGSARVTAKRLSVVAHGPVSLSTEVNTLDIQNFGDGNVAVIETDAVALDQLNAGSRNVRLLVGGSISLIEGSLITAASIVIRSNGAISPSLHTSVDTLSVDTTTASAVTVTNDRDIRLARVVLGAGRFSLINQGGVTNAPESTLEMETLSIVASGTVELTTKVKHVDIDTQAIGNIRLTQSTSLVIDRIAAKDHDVFVAGGATITLLSLTGARSTRITSPVLVVTGAGLDASLTGGVDYSGTTSGRLELSGPTVDSITRHLINTTSGQIDINGVPIRYSGVTTVSDTQSALHRTFDFSTAPIANRTVTLADNGVANDRLSRLTTGIGAAIDFPNPITELAVILGDGNDTLSFTGFDPMDGEGNVFAGGITVNGALGNDTLSAPTGGSKKSWHITGSNSGDLNKLLFFSSIEALRGGTSDDEFLFVGQGTISGVVDGGGHTTKDIANYSASDFIQSAIIEFFKLPAGVPPIGPTPRVFTAVGGLSNMEAIVVLQLAEVRPDGTLVLNMGPRAPQRLAINIVDGDESFEIVHVSGNPLLGSGETVAVTALGVTLEYARVKMIYAEGGAFNDTITIRAGVLAPVELWGDQDPQPNVPRDAKDVVITGKDGADLLEVLGSNVAVLQGGGGNDDLRGGAANDTLVGGLGDDMLSGGAGDDLYLMTDAWGDDEVVELQGGGRDRLDFSLNANGVLIRIGDATSTTMLTVSANNGHLVHVGGQIERIVGSQASDELIGPDRANAWALNASNTGTLNSALEFSSVENLTGGTTNDDFTFANNASVSGVVAAGDGYDTLNYASYSTAITLDREAQTTTGVGDGFLSIERVVGGQAADTLVGLNAPTSWRLTALNGGNVGGSGVFDFVSIENLIGGSSDDTFIFNHGHGVSGTIKGGTGINSLDYSAYSTGVAVNLAAGNATGTKGIANIRDITGGSANDVLDGDDQTNVLRGSAGADSLTGAAGDDILIGDEGDDTIHGNDGDDDIFGGADNDLIYGDSGADRILGDSGTISPTEMLGFQSPGGKDTIFGGLGDDAILGGPDADSISGNEGDDLLLGDNGSASFAAGVLVSVQTRDAAVGAADTILGGDGANVVLGGEGADVITTGAGADVIVGDNGIVEFTSELLTLVQTTQSDVGGIDTITAGNGANVVFGGLGGDVITTGLGSDLILGDSGSATFAAGVLTHVASVDMAIGGSDVIEAGEGDNTILGGAGLNRVTTGAGRDVVLGDSGVADFDVVAGASRLRKIETVDAGIGGVDTVQTGSGADLIFGGADGDTLLAAGTDTAADVVVGDSGVATFDDAGVLATIATTSPTVGGDDDITTGDGADVIFGGVGSDFIDVSRQTGSALGTDAGRDVVLGDNGSVSYVAGVLVSIQTSDAEVGAADTIWAGDGANVVLGGVGADIITTGQGADLVIADNGILLFGLGGLLSSIASMDPSIGGNDHVTSGAGDDVVIGGFANDDIQSGSGEDVVFGDGGEVLFEGLKRVRITSTGGDLGGSDDIESNQGADVVIGGPGEDFLQGQDGDDVVIGDQGEATYDLSGSLANVLTTSGEIGSADWITGGNGRDILVGGVSADAIYAEDGDDVVVGDLAFMIIEASRVKMVTSVDMTLGTGDVIWGGLGNDTIIGGAGSDRARGEEGKDLVVGDGGVILFLNGIRQHIGSIQPTLGDGDELYGDLDDDILVGGAGNDLLYGFEGADILIGDNAELEFVEGTLRELRSIATIAGGDDTIRGGDGDDVLFGGTANDLMVGGIGDDLMMGDHGHLVYDRGQRSLLESTEDRTGGDDSLLGELGDDILLGGLGNDTLSGAEGRDVAVGDQGRVSFLGGQTVEIRTLDNGFGGRDEATGGEADDVLMGGAGEDRLSGGLGDDLIIGDGGFLSYGTLPSIQFSTEDSGLGAADTMQGGEGHDVLLGGFGSDTIESGSGNDWLMGDNGAISISNGRVVDAEVLSAAVGGDDVLSGGDGDDILVGQAGNDRLFGSSGDDALFGDVVAFKINQGALTEVSSNASEFFGNDTIEGEVGNDWIFGGSGSDAIRSGLGADWVMGDNGVMTLEGASVLRFEGVVSTWDGRDEIITGEGNDRVFGGGDVDRIVGEEGNDLLIGDLARVDADAVGLLKVISLMGGNEGADDLLGGLSSDVIIGGLGNDSIEGASGDDLLIGDGGQIVWNLGNYVQVVAFDGTGGADTLLGAEGSDVILGGGGDDTIEAGVGEDVVFGDESVVTYENGVLTRLETNHGEGAGHDSIDAGDGNDSVFGGLGRDQIRAGAGNDAIIGDQGWLMFVSGRLDAISSINGAADATSDTILGEEGADWIIGGTGNDSLVGGGGSDWILADTGTIEHVVGGFRIATTPGVGGDDTVRGESGEDVILGGGGADTISGGENDDWVWGDTGFVTLGSDGIVRLVGEQAAEDGNDILSGDEGDDLLFGGTGLDHLDGGVGNDIILGDTGTIQREAGFTVDIETTTASPSDDTIDAGDGDDLVLAGSGRDQIRGGVGSDILVGDDAKISLPSGLIARLMTNDLLAKGDDILHGDAGDDVVIGGSGSDTLFGEAGTDVLLGDGGELLFRDGKPSLATTGVESGADSIEGGTGDDVLMGGGGSDRMQDEAGSNYFIGDLGQVVWDGIAVVRVTSEALAGGDDDVIQGGSGRDVIFGGPGSDQLSGGESGDLISGDAGELVASGSGVLTLAGTSGRAFGDDRMNGGDGDDVLLGGSGSDRLNGGSGRDLLVGDEAVLDWTSQGAFRVAARGGVGHDTLVGDQGDDILVGGAGTDELDGGEGLDLLVGDEATTTAGSAQTSYPVTHLDTLGGSGGANDRLVGAAGNDVLLGGDGADVLSGDAGDDLILGDGGSVDWATGVVVQVQTGSAVGVGTDTLNGGDGDDILIGGSQNDAISGHAGDDIVLGDSGQVLWDTTTLKLARVETRESTDDGGDTIHAGAGNDLVLGGGRGDVIEGEDGDDRLVGDQATADYGALGLVGLRTVANQAGAAEDRLVGGPGADVVFGGTGSDSIQGGDGNDILIGGLGEITFQGSQPERLDVVTSDGSDDDTLTDLSGADVLVGGSGSDILRASGDTLGDVLIGDEGQIWWLHGKLAHIDAQSSKLGGADTLLVGSGASFALGGASSDLIELARTTETQVVVGDDGSIEFSDGNVRDVVATTSTGDGADTARSEFLVGVLFGGGSDDVMTIGGGAPMIVGDGGSATFNLNTIVRVRASVSTVDGNDRLLVTDGTSVVLGGGGNDLIDSSAGAGADVLVGDGGEVLFEAGEVVSVQSAAGAGQDRIIAGHGADVVLGGGGQDDIQGGSGTDVILGDTGWVTFERGDEISTRNAVGNVRIDTEGLLFGNDQLSGNDGLDILIGGPGNDALMGGEGDDYLVGGDVTIRLSLGRVESLVVKQANGSDEDQLEGEAGNDVLVGGAGSDWLRGGEGDDFGFGDGVELTFSARGLVEARPLSGIDSANDELLGDAGTDWLVGQGGADRLEGGEGADRMFGDDITLVFDHAQGVGRVEDAGVVVRGNDTLLAGDGNDLLVGGGGQDSLRGQAGDDVLYGDSARVDLKSEGGNWTFDLLISRSPKNGGNDELFGDIGQDILVGGSGSDTLWGGEGFDLLLGDHAVVFMELPADQRGVGMGGELDENAGPDILHGDEGDDVLIGQEGGDSLFGDAGDDDLVGGSTVSGANDGGDYLDGGVGNDVILGDNGLIGRRALDASGLNWASYPAPFGGLIRTVTRLDYLDRIEGDDSILGGAGDDQLFGQRGDDSIEGGTGDDEIIGGLGADTIAGGSGADLILGDEGTISKTFNADGTPQINAGNWWHRDVVLEELVDWVASVEIGSGQILTPQEAKLLVDSDLVLLGTKTDAQGNVLLNPTSGLARTFAWMFNVQAGQNDSITGGEGSDTLIGQRGNDVLVGGEGNDVVLGDGASMELPFRNDIPTITNAVRWVSGGQGMGVELGLQGRVARPTIWTFTSYAESQLPELGGLALFDASYLPGQLSDAFVAKTGETFRLGLAVVPTATNHAALLPGNDVLSGGAGNDTLVGDDARWMVPVTSAFAGIDQAVSNTSQSVFSMLESLRSLERLSGAPRIGREPVVEFGNDILQGEAGDDVLVGDRALWLVPMLDGLPATEDRLVEATQSYLARLQAVEVMAADLGIAAQWARLSLWESFATQPSVRDDLWLRSGNDVITGDAGHDLVVGDGATFLVPLVTTLRWQGAKDNSELSSSQRATIRLLTESLIQSHATRLNEYILSMVQTLARRLGAEGATLGEVLKLGDYTLEAGNDTLIGGEGRDFMVGDFATVTMPVVVERSGTRRTSSELARAADRLLASASQWLMDREDYSTDEIAGAAQLDSWLGGRVALEGARTLRVGSDLLVGGIDTDQLFSDNTMAVLGFSGDVTSLRVDLSEMKFRLNLLLDDLRISITPVTKSGSGNEVILTRRFRIVVAPIVDALATLGSTAATRSVVIMAQTVIYPTRPGAAVSVSPGGNTLLGEDGNDLLLGRRPTDQLDGGPGTNTLLSFGTSPIKTFETQVSGNLYQTLPVTVNRFRTALLGNLGEQPDDGGLYILQP